MVEASPVDTTIAMMAACVLNFAVRLRFDTLKAAESAMMYGLNLRSPSPWLLKPIILRTWSHQSHRSLWHIRIIYHSCAKKVKPKRRRIYMPVLSLFMVRTRCQKGCLESLWRCFSPLHWEKLRVKVVSQNENCKHCMHCQLQKIPQQCLP